MSRQGSAATVPTLPPSVLGWIEDVAGGQVSRGVRIPGGGTRQGWLIDVRRPDGAVEELFLRYSPVPAGSAFHPLRVEAEVVHALGAAGATVPSVHAVHPSEEAVLLQRITGETWFYQIKDPAEQLRVAQDFIRCLAYTHRLDPAALAVPSLGPVCTAREHALRRIEAVRRRATGPDGTIDPLIRISADWLERHVPDYEGPVVLVQGDTGPGNFMHRDGRITAVLDWELCHFGDPMDDIAWLSLRTVQDTFTHLPDRLVEYAELTGHAIDVDRVWYYRVFAETTMATLRIPEPGAAGNHEVYDVGNRIMYTQLHRRLWLQALNHVMRLGLDRPAPAVRPDPQPWHGLYDDLLELARSTVALIDDPLAVRWTKGTARALRYLRDVDSFGRVHSLHELAELETLLGTRSPTLSAARRSLDAAHRAGTVDDGAYLEHLWNRVMRDDELMREASGALHERDWPPLT